MSLSLEVARYYVTMSPPLEVAAAAGYIIIAGWCHYHAIMRAEENEEELNWKAHLGILVLSIVWPLSFVVFLLIHSDDLSRTYMGAARPPYFLALRNKSSDVDQDHYFQVQAEY